jgi:hypothetical protein
MLCMDEERQSVTVVTVLSCAAVTAPMEYSYALVIFVFLFLEDHSKVLYGFELKC